MKTLTRPAWMEIDLDNLAFNYKNIKKHMNKDSDLMAVVKADAYENGAIQIVKELLLEGVQKFGVAHLSEARHIRKYFKKPEILIMGYTPDYLIKQAIQDNVSMTIYNLDQAKIISEEARKLDKYAKIHIKIETGMNRLGFMPTQESINQIQKIYAYEHLTINGIFTHYAVSDEDPEYTFEQTRKFDEVINGMEKLGLEIPVRHLSNSAAILNFPELNYDMVRAGIVLYGVYPLRTEKMMKVPLKNILSIKAQISNVKEIEVHEKVSYGLTYEATRKTKIATVPIGYADGFNRSLSNVGEAIVNETIVPIVGRICMDQLMLDVTNLEVEIGTEVILMGKSETKEISIEDIAQKAGSIPAEVFCMMNKRIPRVYIKNKKVVEIVDYLLDI